MTLPAPPEVDWTRPPGHFVQFYEREEQLMEAVGSFAAPASPRTRRSCW